jgi:hypothetical protein
MPLQVRGKLTKQEIKETGKLVRSKWYWPKLLLRNSYGLLLVCGVLWATIAKAISRDTDHWQGIAVIWIVIAAILGLAIVSTRRSARKSLEELNRGLPDSISLNAEGVQTKSGNGATSSRPWSGFKGWRESESIVLLDMAETKGFMMLPLSDLIPAEREVLRGMLRSYLPN